jgi:hypothetical protein
VHAVEVHAPNSFSPEELLGHGSCSVRALLHADAVVSIHGQPSYRRIRNRVILVVRRTAHGWEPWTMCRAVSDEFRL